MDKAGKAERAGATKGTERTIRTTTVKAGRRKITSAQKVVSEKAYLTKRALLSAVSRGIKAAAAETMEVQKYNVIAENGWVVKILANGAKEKIKKINAVKRPAKITLR